MRHSALMLLSADVALFWHGTWMTRRDQGLPLGRWECVSIWMSLQWGVGCRIGGLLWFSEGQGEHQKLMTKILLSQGIWWGDGGCGHEMQGSSWRRLQWCCHLCRLWNLWENIGERTETSCQEKISCSMWRVWRGQGREGSLVVCPLRLGRVGKRSHQS